MNREVIGLFFLGEIFFLGGFYLLLFESNSAGGVLALLGMVISFFAFRRYKELKNQ